MSPQLFTLKLGIQPEEYVAQNNLDPKKNINKQPAGLNFYKKRWASDNRGTVYFNHGHYGFKVNNVLSVSGTEDTEKVDRGIYKFNINVGGAPQSLDLHDNVRQRFMEFLQQLLNKGWKHGISYSRPRLKGDDAIRYLIEEFELYNPPPSHRFTLEEWMQIDGPYWQLYADGVLLSITFKRDRSRLDPNKPGSYLFSYELYGIDEMGASQMKSNDRDNWKALWVETIKPLKEIRYKRETELKALGYTIDTDYEDPKIHPADPIEP